MINLSLKNFDWTLFVAVVLLACVGLSIIYSVTLSQETKDYSLLIKQVVFFLIGLILFFAFAAFDYRTLGSMSWLLYFLSFFLLVAVLFFGSSIHGTRGWFIIFGQSFQPVELTKLVMIFFLARFFSGRVSERISFANIAKSLFWVALPVVLILLQPDMGSSITILISWFLLLWFSGLSKKSIFVFVVILALVATVSWSFVLRDYQKERFLNFFNSSRDPLGEGYNVRQSIIAVGSGGMIGRGLGFGPQSQLRFLPETSADFIFAALSEELGFVGVFVVLVLFGLFFWRCYYAVTLARDNFSILLVLGISVMFFLQVLINIGMSIGILPVTGLPLPFISSGGTFLVICLISAGVVESVIARNKGVV